MVEQEPEERQPDYEQQHARPAFGVQPSTGGPRRFTGSLPHWVLADNESEAETAGAESAMEEHLADTAESVAPVVEEHHEETAGQTHGTAGLSDEEVAALSARLVEAKHEETQARADADTLTGGAEFDEEEAEEDEEHDEHEHHEDERENLHEERSEELHEETAHSKGGERLRRSR